MIHSLTAWLRSQGSGASGRGNRQDAIGGHTRLAVDRLEPRVLLYATSGGLWPHPELVTVSFMPDGTDIGGVGSNLVGTMNSRWPAGTWQKEVLRGLQSYAANAKINFSILPDDGSAFGSCGSSSTDCNLQGDVDFGDIRIGGIDLGGALGIAMLPPPINRDTTAGDMFLDTTASWNIGASFDLFTVSAHEAGHSTGLDHSTVTSAVMYDIYTGVKSSLTADDIAGIQAVYGSRPEDSFDAGGSNDTKSNATVITSYIDSNKQVTLSNLDLTGSNDVDWYKISTPSGNSGTMVVQVQSTGLSLLAPKVTVYKGSTLKSTVSGAYNSTISTSQAIGSGQNWFIKVEGAEATVFGSGAYAIQINMGSSPLPPVSSPNTATPVSGPGGNGAPVVHLEQGHDEGAGADESTVVLDTQSSVATESSGTKQVNAEQRGFSSTPTRVILGPGPLRPAYSPDLDSSAGPGLSIIDELLSQDQLGDLIHGSDYFENAVLVDLL